MGKAKNEVFHVLLTEQTLVKFVLYAIYFHENRG